MAAKHGRGEALRELRALGADLQSKNVRVLPLCPPPPMRAPRRSKTRSMHRPCMEEGTWPHPTPWNTKSNFDPPLPPACGLPLHVHRRYLAQEEADTPLHVAVACNQLEAYLALHELGADDLDAKNARPLPAGSPA